MIDLSARARGLLACEVVVLKHRLDLPARIRGSLKRNPASWLLGSLGAGLVASLFFFRRRRAVSSKKHRSFPLTLLGLALTALRPFAKVWAADQIKNYLAGQIRGNSFRKPIPGKL